ncbi:ROK family transcriptional regulator [Actinomadura darangshiensis]|uniref:ROK family transcriptional regulator n=1 Tax=Actinomadura darangshiensis TaxID=705336 RepID=A0A4R5AA46_9ACTN|nr:ROK family transcriptional regulator [Actinomadura darangshiensis]TDD69163.1 ROK family transcriptional regulator [Actinomadura darangshiensis]
MPRAATRRPSTAGDILRLIREDGVATRADLGRITGLSRPAVASRVAALISRGLVVEHADGPSTGGRPPARLRFNAAGGTVLVANLGQSRGQVAICDLAGTILARADGPPAEVSPGKTLPRLLDQWTTLLSSSGVDPAGVRGVGLGVPDAVEHVAGRWDAVEIGAPITERFGVPAYLDNEVNAAALGEHQAHPDVDDLLFVKVSTGIGAGLIAGGRIQRGALGAAGEIGHVPVPSPDEAPCRCGNVNCVEAIAGGTALLARSPADDLPGLAALARSGDPATVALLRDAGRRIGEVVATAVNLLNPAVVVLGGDLVGADEPLIAGLRETVYQRSTALATRTLRIEPSRLGEQAGLTGCAAMVLDHILSPTAIDTP